MKNRFAQDYVLCVLACAVGLVTIVGPTSTSATNTLSMNLSGTSSGALRLVNGGVPGVPLKVSDELVSSDRDEGVEAVDLTSLLPNFAGGTMTGLCVGINGFAGLSSAPCDDSKYDAIVSDFATALTSSVLVPFGRDQISQAKVLSSSDSRTPDIMRTYVARLSAISSVSAGVSHTCAVSTSGGVWCWGAGGLGRLGDGLTINRLTPVQVKGVGGSGVLSDVVSVSAGAVHTCAVSTSGGVWCWGYGLNGALGDGLTSNSSTPVQVKGVGGSGVLSDVVSVSVGAVHTCAVSTSGGVWCWGVGGLGRLGDGLTSDSSTPVQVKGVGGSGVLSDVVSVSAGGSHTCAVSTSGGVWCWGYAFLGVGSMTRSSTPIYVASDDGLGLATGSRNAAATEYLFPSTIFRSGDCVRFIDTGTVLDTAQDLSVVRIDGGNAVVNIAGRDPGANLTRGHVRYSDCVGIPSSISVATNMLINGRRSVIVTWYRMPTYETAVSEVSNTYQLVIIERGMSDYDVEFNYGSLTDTGSSTSYYTAGGVGRIPVGWSGYANASAVDARELVDTVVGVDLFNGGASPLVSNSLNSHVAGRYVIPFRSGVSLKGAWTSPAMNGSATFAADFLPGGAPTAVSAITSDSSAVLSWAPGTDGVADTVGYTVTASPGGESCVTTLMSCTVLGLTPGAAYTFSVVANTSAGASPSGSVSVNTASRAPATTVPVTTTTAAVNVSSAPSLAVINALPRALLSTSPIFTGGKIAVTYTGFTPGETVQLMVASTPRVIGTGVANASGSVTVTGRLPSSLGAGKHTIALYAPISGVGFRQVVSVSAATLPQTGSNSTSPLIAGMMMLISGVVLMASRRRASL